MTRHAPRLVRPNDISQKLIARARQYNAIALLLMMMCLAIAGAVFFGR